MKRSDALRIMQLDDDFTAIELKTQYYRLAKKYHPDKNSSPEAAHEFQQLHAAYEYLNENTACTKTPFEKCIDVILCKSVNFTMDLLKGLNREEAFKVFMFLSQHKQTFSIPDDILESVKAIILKKYENVEIIRLNPTIKDLIDNNSYRLMVDEQEYIVPLWINQSVYTRMLHDESLSTDSAKTQTTETLIVHCIPELPPDTYVVKRDNLEITLKLEVADIIWHIQHNCPIIVHDCFELDAGLLHFKVFQTVVLKKAGLTRVKKDLYDVSDKGDVILLIFIEFYT